MRRIGVLAGAAALAGVALLASQSVAQIKKGKTRPLTTKQMMAGFIAPTSSALNRELQGSGPADDRAWEAAATKAALLNEAAYMLMADDRCPDEAWAAACRAMESGSRQLLARIEARDAAGAAQAFAAVAASCKSCHQAHKK